MQKYDKMHSGASGIDEKCSPFGEAERQGFEPWDPVTGVNGFRDRPIRPLWHLSEVSVSVGVGVVFVCWVWV